MKKKLFIEATDFYDQAVILNKIEIRRIEIGQDYFNVFIKKLRDEPDIIYTFNLKNLEFFRAELLGFEIEIQTI